MKPRLAAIADAVPPCQTVADVGCDHGYLAAELLARGVARRAIACDISARSLAKAEALARRRGPAMETRLGDGLLPLGAGEADAAVIAGMGGYEILHILADPRRRDGITDFVVSPQSDLPAFRAALDGLGLAIIRERVVREGRHFYAVMNLAAGSGVYTPLELEFGLALRAPDDDFLAFLARKERVLGEYLARCGEVGELRQARARVREAIAAAASLRQSSLGSPETLNRSAGVGRGRNKE